MFIPNPFKETGQQNQTTKRQNTWTFKMMLNLSRQGKLNFIIPIAIILWCLMRPAVWLDYCIHYEPSFPHTFPILPHMVWSGESLQPSEDAQIRQETCEQTAWPQFP